MEGWAWVRVDMRNGARTECDVVEVFPSVKKVVLFCSCTERRVWMAVEKCFSQNVLRTRRVRVGILGNGADEVGGCSPWEKIKSFFRFRSWRMHNFKSF